MVKGKTIKSSFLVRWSILFLAIAVIFFNYFFNDALSPLKDLMQLNLGFSSTDYGLFISAYSVSSVFLLMAVLGGIILNKIVRIKGFFVCFCLYT